MRISVCDPWEKGVYTMLVDVNPSAKIRVGEIGRFEFLGLYTYTGSAIGTGASSLNGRISRHMSRNKKTWWHIDYLLRHPSAVVKGTVFSLTLMKSKECEVSQNILDSIEGFPIGGFGSSDCSCSSHLIHLPRNPSNSFQSISEAHRRAGLEPRIAGGNSHRGMLLFRENKHILG